MARGQRGRGARRQPVRLTVDVSTHELEHAVEHAAADLSKSAKIPGFRQGRVPRQVLYARLGQGRIFAEAVDSHIGGWFWNAAALTAAAGGIPEYEYDLPATAEQPWQFAATVEVQPTPEIVDWTTLEVPRAEAEIPEELVQQELDALRESIAELAPADERPAREGDAVVVDLAGGNGQSQSDTVVELGSGRLVDEIESALVGASVGETRHVEYELADGGSTAVDWKSSTSTRRCCRPSTTSSRARPASSTRWPTFPRRHRAADPPGAR